LTNNRQLYYQSELYQDEVEINDDEISSICDVLHFAIKKGLEISGIKPY